MRNVRFANAPGCHWTPKLPPTLPQVSAVFGKLTTPMVRKDDFIWVAPCRTCACHNNNGHSTDTTGTTCQAKAEFHFSCRNDATVSFDYEILTPNVSATTFLRSRFCSDYGSLAITRVCHRVRTIPSTFLSTKTRCWSGELGATSSLSGNLVRRPQMLKVVYTSWWCTLGKTGPSFVLFGSLQAAAGSSRPPMRSHLPSQPAMVCLLAPSRRWRTT